MESLTVSEKHTLNRKSRALAADKRRGLILDQPVCACGWKGDKPAVYGAGCPNCGQRITKDGKGKK